LKHLFNNKNLVSKNIIIFRTDQLGDFIIISNIIYHIKKKYPNSIITLVCSKFNYKIIKNYNFINNVIIYDKLYPIKKKIKILKKICQNKYFISLLDGQKFSYFANCLIKSQHKLCIITKYITKFFNCKIVLQKPSFFYTLLFITRSVFVYSRKSKIFDKTLIDKYLELFSIFNLRIINRYKYFFPQKKKIYNKYHDIIKKLNFNKFIVINFDEKWNDILDIENQLLHQIIKFQKENNLNVLITSFKNNHFYFNNFKKKFKFVHHKIKFIKNILKLNNNIYILEDLNIFLLEKFLSKSLFSISCHSGFITQSAGFNNSKIIDIINYDDYFWYKTWIPKKIFHRFVFKSINNKKISLNIIFKNLNKIIKNN
jgi:ADP-heptose:LPS heptosyltransferase